MFDANTHLLEGASGDQYSSPDDIMQALREQWSQIDEARYKHLLTQFSEEMDQFEVQKAVLQILDEHWYENKRHEVDYPEHILPGFLLDPFADNLREQVNALSSQNICFAKILPYEQNIFRNRYQEVYELAELLEEQNIVLSICCAYGSRYIYKTNGVELAAYLVNQNIESPIILAHGGLNKILDAMSLCIELENLYLDISFSLSYIQGSSIETDYAFAFEKLNYDDIFYGSNYPYISLEDSLERFHEFCVDHDISESDRQKISSGNFHDFLSNHDFLVDL